MRARQPPAGTYTLKDGWLEALTFVVALTIPIPIRTDGGLLAWRKVAADDRCPALRTAGSRIDPRMPVDVRSLPILSILLAARMCGQE